MTRVQIPESCEILKGYRVWSCVCVWTNLILWLDPQDADDDEEAVGGFDFTAGEGTFNQDDYTMQPDSSLNNTMLMGDKLVSQPNKVSQGC